MLDSAEWDFSYLEKHEHLKRSAVLYEYGRENRELVKWVFYLREFGPFRSSKTYLPAEKGVEDKIQQRIHQEIDVLSFNEILFLTTSKNFPSQPFQLAIEHLDPQICKYVGGGVISEPLRQIREIPDGAWFRAQGPSSAADPSTSKEESVHIFAIPWRGTSNDELASQFRAWLDAHRPKQFASGRRRGRNSGASAGANDKLHQLSAYRLRRAGVSREQAWTADFKNYSSEHAWNRAVSEASTRIRQVYPFGSSESPQ